MLQCMKKTNYFQERNKALVAVSASFRKHSHTKEGAEICAAGEISSPSPPKEFGVTPTISHHIRKKQEGFSLPLASGYPCSHKETATGKSKPC